VIVCLAANPSIDKLFEIDRLVKGDIHRPQGFVQVAGGKGLNVARSAHTLGADVIAAALLRGHAGKWLEEQLSAEGVPFLMHDATLERTTNGIGLGGDQPWDQLARLDAGSWHSRQYAGEPLPTFENIARYCLANGACLNIEIKPTPGLEEKTGQVVADHAARIWRGQAVPPLLTFLPGPGSVEMSSPAGTVSEYAVAVTSSDRWLSCSLAAAAGWVIPMTLGVL